MTFSIVGCDRKTGELGVAVQSRVVAVGAVVPWGEAGVGALAVQALSDRTFGSRGLSLLREGRNPDAVLTTLLEADSNPGLRQVALVDAAGRAAVHTGINCPGWAGGLTGDSFAASGNTLTGPEVVQSISRTFEGASGTLAERLLASLAAGQRSGGDRRGMQSAALLVVRGGWGYAGSDDRYIDLRVDEHSTPIIELTRIFRMFQPVFRGRPPVDIELTPAIVEELQEITRAVGLYSSEVTGAYDERTRDAVHALVVREQLEDRWKDNATIDASVLAYLREFRSRA